jgi:hypothetical protein
MNKYDYFIQPKKERKLNAEDGAGIAITIVFIVVLFFAF